MPEGFSNRGSNMLVQVGRLRRPKIVIDVFVSLAGADAPAKDTKTSKKG